MSRVRVSSPAPYFYCMSNFIFIDHNVDIGNILLQLEDHPEDWNEVASYNNIGGLIKPTGFLPLVMGHVENIKDNIKHSQLQRRTPLWERYTEIRKWLESYNIYETSRAAFFRLPVGGGVGNHIDDGDYYLTRDRYHLSLQGEYMYNVGGEQHLIKPGTFFWFDNKKEHWSKNVSEVDRITFVFDLIHSPSNPQHGLNKTPTL